MIQRARRTCELVSRIDKEKSHQESSTKHWVTHQSCVTCSAHVAKIGQDAYGVYRENKNLLWGKEKRLTARRTKISKHWPCATWLHYEVL